MVISIKAGLFEAVCLFFREHPQGGANFQSLLTHRLNHFEDPVEVGVISHLTPSCAHAEASGAMLFRQAS